MALLVAVLGSRTATNAPMTTESGSTSRTLVHVVVSPSAVRTSTRVPHPIQLIPVEVRAYTIEGPMADGKWTHRGACAVSTAQFPLGTILYLYNPYGSFNSQCIAEDTGSDIGYGQIDLAMPDDTAGATRWGVRHLLARVVRRGWGGNGSPTILPTP
jgi:3D (Asp-Asp-Asp) domain-containing protein